MSTSAIPWANWRTVAAAHCARTPTAPARRVARLVIVGGARDEPDRGGHTRSMDGAPGSADDARRKAQHALRLMLIARELVGLASTDRQQRILARYAHLNA